MRPAAIIYYYPCPDGRRLSGNDWADLVGPDVSQAGRFAANTRLENSRGPDGGRGLLITWQQDVLVQYDPDTQDWRRIGHKWVGVRRDYTSEEFAKQRAIGRYVAPGYPVTMADGRDYTVPVALADAPSYGIPWRETYDETGAIRREVDPHYRAVCNAADMLWKAINDDGQLNIDEDDLRAAAVNALQVNYNLHMVDCLALGLFSSESYMQLICAVLDVPSIPDLLKKKASGT